MIRIIIPFAALLLFASQVFAASFDCAKAKTTMEKTVCSDSRLSALDDELAKLYAETRAELKKRPKELKKLIKDQRHWLVSIKKTPIDYLRDDYKSRINELKHTLNLARATVSTVSGPSKDVVIKRLAEQLDKLKELARKADKVEISETIKANKPAVCENIWNNIQQATVPEPSVYANTGQQKQEIYMQLREMALHNKKLFFDMGNVVKEPENYKNRFGDLWKKYSRDLSEYDGSRMDSANLLFIQPDTKAGFKQPIFVTILLDLDEKGLSLNREDLRADGLLYDELAGHSEGSYSREYFDDNFLDEPQSLNKRESPADYAGLMTLGNEIMFWKADKNPLTYDKNWSLIIRPILNTSSGQEISCSYDFDSNLKE